MLRLLTSLRSPRNDKVRYAAPRSALMTHSLLSTTVQAQPIGIPVEQACTDHGSPPLAMSSAPAAQDTADLEKQRLEEQVAAERRTVQRVGYAFGLIKSASIWSSWPSVLTPAVLRVLPFLSPTAAGVIGLIPAFAATALVGYVLSAVGPLVFSILADVVFEDGKDDGANTFDLVSSLMHMTYDFLWPTGLAEGWTIDNFSRNSPEVVFGFLQAWVGVYALNRIVFSPLLMAQEAAALRAQMAQEAALRAQIAQEAARWAQEAAARRVQEAARWAQEATLRMIEESVHWAQALAQNRAQEDAGWVHQHRAQEDARWSQVAGRWFQEAAALRVQEAALVAQEVALRAQDDPSWVQALAQYRAQEDARWSQEAGRWFQEAAARRVQEAVPRAQRRLYRLW
jgi:hypothetical protein